MNAPKFRTVTASVVLLATVALAQSSDVCTASGSEISVERRLRQLTLDLLGRPPTLEEYRFARNKGAIVDEDIRALMGREDFFSRLKTYHRSLLRANISGSITTEIFSRVSTSSDNAKPLEIRGVPSTPLRGKISAGCSHLIEQDKCDTQREDPNLEPTTKICRDELGVPLPVAVDYNADQYTCTQVTGATSCADAMTQGVIPAKHYFYCDMRALGTGALAPHYCVLNQNNPVTAAMTTEVLDGSNRVIAFVNPAPLNGQLARLDRCTTTMLLSGGVKGRYVAQPGCVQKEGYVTQAPPYWLADQATPVNICAIEAQDRLVNPWTMESCESSRFLNDRSCGCGVRGRRCEPSTGEIHTARIAAFNEEPLRIIDSVVRRDEDYFTILTTRRSFMNGPLSQLYRETQSPTLWLATAPAAREAMPNVPLANTTDWFEYTRDENASGVLTTAEWLYRFPTRRSRVSQFWQAFLCKSFSPPAGVAVPPPEDSCNRENNLAKRCGCSYCHATIEPVGAHWGRYGERNAQFLSPDVFPRFSAKCHDCALNGDTNCDNQCGNYVMQASDGAGASSLGLLSTYLYRTNDEEVNIVGGPKLLVDKMMQTGDLERCAVKNVWNAMLGRPMTSDEENMYLKQLMTSFAADNHNFKSLVLEVVKTDAYWRVD